MQSVRENYSGLPVSTTALTPLAMATLFLLYTSDLSVWCYLKIRDTSHLNDWKSAFQNSGPAKTDTAAERNAKGIIGAPRIVQWRGFEETDAGIFRKGAAPKSLAAVVPQ